MSRNGKGIDTTVVINLKGLKKDVSTFKDLYTDIEAKKGMTTKSMVCFDMVELADTAADQNGNVSITYCNAAQIKLLTGLLTKLDIIHNIVILKQVEQL